MEKNKVKINTQRIKQLIEQEVKKQADVAKVAKKLETYSSQLGPLLDRVNTRVEFEQFLRDSIKLGSKNVKGQDIVMALTNVLKQVRKETQK
jgi:hypothetical protein